MLVHKEVEIRDQIELPMKEKKRNLKMTAKM